MFFNSDRGLMKLIDHRYGKARVRVLKILRSADQQSIIEVDVTVMVTGDFDSSYVAADNSKVVPTDTIKNTINVLAREHLDQELERFGLFLAKHFLGKYGQIETATVEISQRDWRRMNIDGKAHPHSFVAGSQAQTVARLICRRVGPDIVESGIRDLVMLKSTGSGFQNYPRDEFTTLAETSDRILATSFNAIWTYGRPPANYRATNENILGGICNTFAVNYSPSAQTTLFQMGRAALAVAPEISKIQMTMPNKHYLLVDFSPFHLDNDNEVFTPTNEPHGQIEGTVTRED